MQWTKNGFNVDSRPFKLRYQVKSPTHETRNEEEGRADYGEAGTFLDAGTFNETDDILLSLQHHSPTPVKARIYLKIQVYLTHLDTRENDTMKLPKCRASWGPIDKKESCPKPSLKKGNFVVQ